ncbi:MAG: HlyC/CorC family transporter [Acidobacteriota bacterium]|nr:HlyC/CorC family transporter [Acidobacteriota bacterium]
MDHLPLHIGARLLAILALVFANGFFVAAEFSLVTVRKTRVDQLIAEGNRWARALRRATNDPDSYIAATQLGITMASIGLGWIGEPALASLVEPAFSFLPGHLADVTAHSVAVGIAFALITALHIVLGELAPKTVALQHAEKTALWVIKPTELFMKVFWPFIALLNAMGRMVVATFGLDRPSRHALVHSEQELKMLVTASQEAGVLEEGEEQMLHRVFDFADLTAGQVMVPRTEMVALPADLTLAQALERIARGPHTRLPVYRGDLDDIVGILLVTDLFRTLAAPPERFSLAALAREALVVPETMKADALLAEMRRRRTRQAIVIDEYGGTAGLVTFERLMERIVGEIGGEFGALTAQIMTLPDGASYVDGLALVTDVNQQFDLHIDETMYTTVGGYVLGRLGRRAAVGDTIDVEQRTLRVETLDGLRVARVWLSRPREGDDRQADGA